MHINELIRRTEKRDAIVAVLVDAHVSPELAREMATESKWWKLVAMKAMVNKPSQTTIAEVIREMERVEVLVKRGAA